MDKPVNPLALSIGISGVVMSAVAISGMMVQDNAELQRLAVLFLFLAALVACIGAVLNVIALSSNMWWPYILLACVNGALLIALLASVISGGKLSYERDRSETWASADSRGLTDASDVSRGRSIPDSVAKFFRGLSFSNKSTSATGTVNNKEPKGFQGPEQGPEQGQQKGTEDSSGTDLPFTNQETSLLRISPMDVTNEQNAKSYLLGMFKVMGGYKFDSTKYTSAMAGLDENTDIDILKYLYIEQPPDYQDITTKNDLSDFINAKEERWTNTVKDMVFQTFDRPEWQNDIEFQWYKKYTPYFANNPDKSERMLDYLIHNNSAQYFYPYYIYFYTTSQKGSKQESRMTELLRDFMPGWQTREVRGKV
jgi:hypothetical protein